MLMLWRRFKQRPTNVFSSSVQLLLRRVMLKRASSGDSKAQLCVGEMYENGTHSCDVDLESAAGWYELAAERNNKDGCFAFGRFKQCGIGTSRSFLEAALLYEKCGSSLALCYAGSLYQHGGIDREVGVSKDAYGGYTPNFSKAFKLYKEAYTLDNTNTTAMCLLGYMYQAGLCVRRDYNLAAGLFEKAKELGNPIAKCHKAFLLEHGLGCPIDLDAALNYYKDAAEDGEYSAIFQIGRLPYMHFSPSSLSPEYVNWFVVAGVIKKNIVALYHIGRLAEFGIILASDAFFAETCYKNSEDIELPETTFRLGYLYETGVARSGVDYKLAFQCYKMAAQEMCIDAIYRLGWLHEHGLGVKRNFELASEYYLIAAQENYKDALYRLELVNRVTQLPDSDEAFGIFLKSAELGNVDSQCRVAYSFDCGLNRGVDTDKSLQFWKLAAKHYHPVALYRLERGTPLTSFRGTERLLSILYVMAALGIEFRGPAPWRRPNPKSQKF